MLRRIAVMTSGGDAPGMNPAVRAVVRTAVARGVEVYGIRQAYAGLLAGDFERLTSRDVSGIMQRGGTILQTARNKEFETPQGQKRASGQTPCRRAARTTASGARPLECAARNRHVGHREHYSSMPGRPVSGHPARQYRDRAMLVLVAKGRAIGAS